MEHYDSDQMDSASPQGLGQRIEQLIVRLGRGRGSEPSRSPRRPMQLVGLAMFLGATVLGVLAPPDIDREISWSRLGRYGYPLRPRSDGDVHAL